MSRSKTPTANATEREDGLAETVRTNAAPRMLESEAILSSQGHPEMNKVNSQGAALAVGVCFAKQTDAAHANWTIGGLTS